MNVFAILGYVIKSMTLLGFSREEIKKVISDMRISMDIMTEEEAKDAFDEFME